MRMDPQATNGQTVETTKPRRLSVKQRKFVKGVIMGKSGTQSALEAYNTDDVKVASVIASENLTKPSIRQAIEEALTGNDLSLHLVTGNLKKLANSEPEKVSADTVLKANVEILKLYGAYPGSKHLNIGVNINTKVKDMTFQEAKDALANLRSGSDSILQDVDTQ